MRHHAAAYTGIANTILSRCHAGHGERGDSRYVDFRDAIQPFIEQNRLVNLYAGRSVDLTPAERKVLLSSIEENLFNCRQSTQWVREQRLQHGTSLAQTFVIVRLEQQVERMLVIVDALEGDNFFNTDRFVDYFITVVKNENRKNSLSEFLSDNLGCWPTR